MVQTAITTKKGGENVKREGGEGKSKKKILERERENDTTATYYPSGKKYVTIYSRETPQKFASGRGNCGRVGSHVVQPHHVETTRTGS